MPGEDSASRKRGRIEAARRRAARPGVRRRRPGHRQAGLSQRDRAGHRSRRASARCRRHSPGCSRRSISSALRHRPSPSTYVLDEWLRSVELEDTTRRTYVGYIDRTIAPALGSVAADKLSALTWSALRRAAPVSEALRWASARSNIASTPSTTARRLGASRTSASRCPRPPFGRSTRSSAAPVGCRAVGLDHLESRRVALRPRAKAPEPDPPSPADAARLLDAAFALDEDWGTLVLAGDDDRHPSW